MRRSEIRRDDLSDAWIEANADAPDLADWRYMREQHPRHVEIVNGEIDKMLEYDKVPRDETLRHYIDRTIEPEATRRIMHGILVETNAYHVQTDEARLERIMQGMLANREQRDRKLAERRARNAAAARRYRARKRAERQARGRASQDER